MLDINCFTTSYNRPYNIYHTINSILNQSFKDFTYSVVINTDNAADHDAYIRLLKDFTDDQRLKIHYFMNSYQYINYNRALSYCNNYDNSIYIKIDDDDIYHKNYIANAIEKLENIQTDILSFDSYIYINNNNLKNQRMNSIGEWKNDIEHKTQFGMPPTYVFNNKAKKIIDSLSSVDYSHYAFEDMVWRDAWRKNELNSCVFKNDIFIYNIHNNNISSRFLLDKNDIKHIDTEFCEIIFFKHSYWSSYIILNKRNGRLFNINNQDHGTFTKKNHNTIEINWEKWNKEEFKLLQINNIPYYEYIQ